MWSFILSPLLHLTSSTQWVPGDAAAEDYAAYIDDQTKAVYTESIANPKYLIADIVGLAKASTTLCLLPRYLTSCYQVAHAKGVPLIVDNTFGMGGT
jgi:O-acetylhomoserine/O-acetylserine sulfhydrylase